MTDSQTNGKTKNSANKSVKRLKKKKDEIVLESAVLNINGDANNTILSLCRENGNVVKQVSCGSCGFSNAKKATHYASEVAFQKMIEHIQAYKVKKMRVVIRGIGIGSNMASLLFGKNIEIECITYDSQAAFNGCRPKRQRRT